MVDWDSKSEREVPGVASTRARATIPVRIESLAKWLPAQVYTFSGLCDSGEHIAVTFDGWQDSQLVRVHSECLTGDVFGSARCDCGMQLHEALEMLAERGGVLIYLRQEGRGIGLYNKIDAYILQDRGLDTFEANEALNFAGDERSYEVAAQMLRAIGLDTIRLLTNNQEKVDQLIEAGITVTDVVSTGTFINETNRAYLQAKVAKAGHRLTLSTLNRHG